VTEVTLEAMDNIVMLGMMCVMQPVGLTCDRGDAGSDGQHCDVGHDVCDAASRLDV